MTQVLDCIFSHAQVAKKNQLVIMLIVRWGPAPQVGVGQGLFSLFLLFFLSLLFLPPFSVLAWNPGPSPARQSSVTKPHPQPSPNNF